MNSRLRWWSLTSAWTFPVSRSIQRAMTFVLVIPRQARVDAGLGRQIGCCRCDGLDSRLFVVGNDRHSPVGFARLGGGSLQNLDLAINAQNLGHPLLELAIATFQIVAHLVRLDLLLAEDLAHHTKLRGRFLCETMWC